MRNLAGQGFEIRAVGVRVKNLAIRCCQKRCLRQLQRLSAESSDDHQRSSATTLDFAEF